MTRQYQPIPTATMLATLDGGYRGDMSQLGRLVANAGTDGRAEWRAALTQHGPKRDANGEKGAGQ